MTEIEKADYLRLADEHAKAGRHEDAAAIYGRLFQTFPDEESFLLALAWAHHDGGNRKQAISCFERLFESELSRNIFTGFAYDELVRIYKSGKQYERLVYVCKRAANAQPRDVALLGELGEAYLKAGSVEDSINAFKKLLEMEPDSAINYCRLGDAHIAQGAFMEAEAAYGRAAEIDPQTACSFYRRLGDSYYESGAYERAEKAFRQCLEIRHDYTLCRCAVGDCLIAQGLLDEAEASYEQAVALSPDSASMFYNRLGNILTSARCYQEAMAAFKKAQEKDRGNPIYRIRIAEARRALGLADAAVEDLPIIELRK